MLSILIIFFIIYMLILKNNSKLEFKKLIDYLLEDLKYLILPTGFIFALFSALDLKWFSGFFRICFWNSRNLWTHKESLK